MPNLPLSALIDPVAPGNSLTGHVYNSLRRRIADGRLGLGDKLPPTRQLAEETGLSRSTIIAAYDQLVAEGYAEGRQGSGVYIRDFTDIEPISTVAAALEPPERYLHRPAAFSPGLADERLFPADQWGKTVAKAAKKAPLALVHEPDSFGNQNLRHQICLYLAEWRGMQVTSDQVVMTAGSAEALDLILTSIMKADDHIALENPGYASFLAMTKRHRLDPVFMEMDQDGTMPPTEATKLAFLTPSSQFPMGGALPVGRRKDFLAWAAQHDALVIEDDYDSELRYGGRPLPAMASLPGAERVLYVGSFTKTFSPDIRLGYAVIPPSLINLFRQTLERRASHASSMAQLPLSLFMESGQYYRHIRRIRRLYKDRRQVLLSHLKDMRNARVTLQDHRAGMHVTLEFPSSVDDAKIEAACKDRGLGCVALSKYSPVAPAKTGLLLGFTSDTIDEIEQAWPKLEAILSTV